MHIDKRSSFGVSVSMALALFLSQAAHADNGFNALSDMFTYSGFGTAGFAHSDTSDAEWVQNIQSVGSSDNFDYKTDSKLAVQGTVTPTQWLSGTAQVLTEQRFGPAFTTKFEWAFIKVKPLPGLSIRGGELELPTFLVSDTRNVGYANTWLRAPDEVYGEAGFDTYNGYDVTYQHAVGPYTLSVNALAGAAVTNLQLTGTAAVLHGHELRGYNATLDMGTIIVRAGRVTTGFTVSLGPYILARGTYSFDSVGATYDNSKLLIQGEFIERRTNSPAFNVNGMYLLGGYHLGKWMPYGIYAAGQSLGGGSATGFVHSVSKHTVSAGVRLDWFQNVDFKAQVDHVTGTVNGEPFTNVQPAFGNSANVVSLAVDFVF
jgi:hypothetical protein